MLPADWTSWGSWGPCSASCCGGDQSRLRICVSCGQLSTACSGSSSETRSCGNVQCPGKTSSELHTHVLSQTGMNSVSCDQ